MSATRRVDHAAEEAKRGAQSTNASALVRRQSKGLQSKSRLNKKGISPEISKSMQHSRHYKENDDIRYHRKHLNRCSTVGTTKKTMTVGARRKHLNRHNETTKCRKNYGPSIKSEPTHSGATHGGPRTHGGEAVGGGLWGPLSASSACTPTGDVGCSKNTNSEVKSRATQKWALWPNHNKGVHHEETRTWMEVE